MSDVGDNALKEVHENDMEITGVRMKNVQYCVEWRS